MVGRCGMPWATKEVAVARTCQRTTRDSTLCGHPVADGRGDCGRHNHPAMDPLGARTAAPDASAATGAAAEADPFAGTPPLRAVPDLPYDADSGDDSDGEPKIAPEDWSRDCDEHGQIKAMCPQCYPHLALKRDQGPRYGGPSRGPGAPVGGGWSNPNSKQAQCNKVADVFGDGREYPVSVGSSTPRQMFVDVYDRYGLECPATDDKPLLAQGIVEFTEGSWDDSCDSSGSDSGGGSTVTAEGMRRFVDAVTYLEDLFGADVNAPQPA
jgi:hypothetical protein